LRFVHIDNSFQLAVISWQFILGKIKKKLPLL
jgi:hypothetical protein